MQPILLIDDDETLTSVLSVCLEGYGFACEVANCGEDGLNMLSEKEFSVVLLDSQLGDMDGLAVLAAIKEKGYVVPVIMATGSLDVEMLDKALDSGARDVISKPFNFRQLAEQLRLVLAG